MDHHALVLVDVQRGFEDTGYWGRRNNPDLEQNLARLVTTWRQRARPLVVVQHDSSTDGSPLRTGTWGHAFAELVPEHPDLLVRKSVNSAFHGEPDLHEWLVGNAVEGIVVAGITTNHCCETTARVGANLGHEVLFVLDATATFDRPDPWGGAVSADELARVTAANLHGEFATVVQTEDLIGP